MSFFAEFWSWLGMLLATYIGVNTARVASIIEPVVLVLGTLYVLVWGYLQLQGRIEEPWITGVKKIFLLAVIFGVSLRLWLYNTVLVDSFFRAPAQFASLLVGAFDPIALIDQVMIRGSDAAGLLLEKAGFLDGEWSFYIAGFAIYVIVGITAVYTVFLLALSRIALSVLLALGPLFIALLLFDTTRRFVESWLAQLANYAFVTLLTVMVAALMLQLIEVAAAEAAARGDGIQIAEALRVCLAAGLVLLVMRQVMPMAASLAHGLALTSFGAMSALVAWGWGRATRQVGQFARGALLDRDSTRWDSLPRQAGFGMRQGLSSAMTALRARSRLNRLSKVKR